MPTMPASLTSHGLARRHGDVELITYPDSLGGDLPGLESLLTADLAGLFPGGVHILPPFPSTSDRGFAPVRYDQVDPAFGTWRDITAIARSLPVTVDIMVNHVSRDSDEFRDVVRHGRDSPWFDAFITPAKIWPDGPPAPSDLAKIHLRKPDHPFTTVALDDGTDLTIWTTFAMGRGPSNQIDLDITSPVTWNLYRQWFATLAEHGVSRVRLDAVGYLTKAAGTSCFMVEPAIWEHLDAIRALAADNGLTVLPEVHAGAAQHHVLLDHGFQSYDFVLPALVLDALTRASAEPLAAHVADARPAQITMLDCHDGIPAHPDLDGTLGNAEIAALAELCVLRGANLSLAHERGSTTPHTHQINCTYRSAVGSDAAMVAARAIQLFVPGHPQVYYVGLLAGRNVAVDATADGRDVNRHNFGIDEVRTMLASEPVQRQLELIRLRNSHPAFDGACDVRCDSASSISITRSNGDQSCRLDVDLLTHVTAVTATTAGGAVASSVWR